MAKSRVQYIALWGGLIAGQYGYRWRTHDSADAAEETIASLSQAERETCFVFKGHQVGFQHDTHVEILE